MKSGYIMLDDIRHLATDFATHAYITWYHGHYAIKAYDKNNKLLKIIVVH